MPKKSSAAKKRPTKKGSAKKRPPKSAAKKKRSRPYRTPQNPIEAAKAEEMFTVKQIINKKREGGLL